MAVKTTYQLIDFLTGTESFGILAHDINGVEHELISNAMGRRYIWRNYGERRYSVLTGEIAATPEEADQNFQDDFIMWINNRAHNIDRQYQALFDYDYSPIENVDRYETENTRTDDDITYGKRVASSGTDTTNYGKTVTDSGTDTQTYGKTLTDSGTDTTTYGKVVSNAGSDSVTNGGHDVFEKEGARQTTNEATGFNAPNAYTPHDRQTETFTDYQETTNYGKTETTQHGLRVTDSGSDSLQHGKVETEGGSDTLTHGKVETEGGSDSLTHGKTDTESGADNRDIVTGRSLHVHGNIGVTTNNQLIDAEIEMRMKSLAEMLLDNFINDYTFYS